MTTTSPSDNSTMSGTAITGSQLARPRTGSVRRGMDADTYVSNRLVNDKDRNKFQPVSGSMARIFA